MKSFSNNDGKPIDPSTFIPLEPLNGDEHLKKPRHDKGKSYIDEENPVFDYDSKQDITEVWNALTDEANRLNGELVIIRDKFDRTIGSCCGSISWTLRVVIALLIAFTFMSMALHGFELTILMGLAGDVNDSSDSSSS